MQTRYTQVLYLQTCIEGNGKAGWTGSKMSLCDRQDHVKQIPPNDVSIVQYHRPILKKCNMYGNNFLLPREVP